ncbi:unnamed protein product, partial [Meganyctiphanes norvegica]
MALVKTYNTDKQVPDSAATATAYLGGVKTNWFTVGVDSRVQLDDCFASLQRENQVDSILAWAQAEGKRTGFVTTTRITHATPAATYAHTSNRTWEYDQRMPAQFRGICKDIADQLITDNTGRNINVMMGGGREMFGACTSSDNCETTRVDGRNLVNEWLSDKEQRGLDAEYVSNPSELQSVSSDTDYVLGLFSKSHLPYKLDIDAAPANFDIPSLEEMMLKAIQVLEKGNNGFVLLVEGGRIDHGLHHDWTRKALEETLEFDHAITAAKKVLDIDETLVVVTADHSHPITINGYPERGNDILGIAGHDKFSLGADGLPYTTIMYTNGPGFMMPNKYAVKVDVDEMKKNIMDPTGALEQDDDNEIDVDNEPSSGISHGKSHMVVRVDQSKVDYKDKDYRHLAAVPRKVFDGTHGGEDVAVYAEGPMSHLFHRLHEQSYVAYVMATAACMGPGLKICQETGRAFGGNQFNNLISNSAFASSVASSGPNRIGQPILPGFVNPLQLLGRHVSVGSLASRGAAASSSASASSGAGASASSGAGASFASSGSASAASSGGASTATAGGATSASTGATSTASAASGGAAASAASASGASSASAASGC